MAVMCASQAEAEALREKSHDMDYQRLERENILRDIDDLTDANEGLKQALDEAQQEVLKHDTLSHSLLIPLFCVCPPF
jgi:hypothetical protein